MNMTGELYLNVKCRLHGANLSRDVFLTREHHFPGGARSVITNQSWSVEYCSAYINVLLRLRNVICSNLTSI